MKADIFHMLFMFARYLVLLLSMFGYGLLIYKKLNIKAEFVPVLVFSSIALIMYAAGLLNIMFSMTFFVLFAGLILFLYLTLSKSIQIDDLKNIFTPGIIIFLFSSIAVLFIYKGAHLIIYDNFSHWGLIVKHMWINNRLPNFSDTLIQYKTYPPGSAVFIYYITFIIGKSEGKALVAQDIFLLSCVLTIFAFIRNNKRLFSYLLAIISSLFLITSTVALDCLYVDTLLPISALANTALILYYRKNLTRAAILSIPLLGFTILVKDSGILFVIVNIFLLLCLAGADCFKKFKNSEKDKILKSLAIIVLVVILPIAFRYLWTQHIEMVFPANTKSTSRHALSLDFFKKTLSNKTDDVKQEVTQVFIDKISSLENQGNQMLIAFNIILLVLLILNLIYRKKISSLIFTILSGNILYAIYQICLYLMYFVSMPPNEAVYLAGYDRYNSSMMCYIIGLGVICIISNMFDELRIKKNKIYNFIIGIASISALSFGISHYKLHHNLMNNANMKSNFNNSVVGRYDNSIKGLNNISSNTYLIYLSPNQKENYIRYMSYYKLLTNKFEIIQTFPSDEFLEKLAQYDYLIVLDNDEAIAEVLSPAIKKESYVGHYNTNQLLDSLQTG